MGSWFHLARRFVGSLAPGGPHPADEDWALGWLQDGEPVLWAQMCGADRRHAVGVARRVVADLGESVDRSVVAAALLHDVGKIDSRLGPFRRAGATVIAKAAGYERCRAWRSRPGARGRLGRYLSHDEIGSDLLRRAGSDELTIAWAREHHLPEDRWSVPAPVGGALKAADDD
jgi:hypothetical protein